MKTTKRQRESINWWKVIVLTVLGVPVAIFLAGFVGFFVLYFFFGWFH